jgi:hypothetical protein
MKEYIYGCLEYCYSGVPVIRGFCSYKTLVKHSSAHSAYQRTAESIHVDEIKNYLASASEYKFMPEIVLSYDYAGLWELPEAWQALGFFTPIEYLYKAPDIVSEQIVIRDHKTGLNLLRLKGGNKNYNLIRLDVSPNSLISQTPIFKRIDGNHRLEALAQLSPEDFQIPYCIILLSNPGEAGEHSRAQTEMEIFHNINSKAKPLTPIEQYRGLLNLFTVSELQKFGKEFSLTKAYIQKYNNLRFNNIGPYLTDKEDIVLFCIRFFLSRGIKITEDDIADIFSRLEHSYFAEFEILRHFKNRFALVPYVYYCYEGGKQKNAKLDAYNAWFIKSRLYEVKDLDPASMIDVFNRIYEIRKKKIFVAMPFKPELDFVFNSICEVVKKINREYQIELLEPIRIDKQIVGFSYDIVNEILDNIQNAGLLIADLTEHNANVYYEAGFAQGLLKAKHGNTAEILYLISNPKKPDEPFSEAKFDVNHYKMISYKNDGNGTAKLKEDIERELKAFYGII